MEQQSRRISIVVLTLALAGLVVVYRSTFWSMAEKWNGDAAFTYGFVIAPISLWMVWRRRDWLLRIAFTPSWWGVVPLLGAAMLWIVARGTGVVVVEQFAVVVMIPALVLTLFGGRALRALLFPLAFLFFMVPFGRAIVPTLVQATADIATWALQVSGIPVWRSHVYISIPDGSFEVAKACSGVAFLMTAIVLGVLYAHLNYTDWKKRMLFVAAAIVVPVLANGVRVYITIAVSHLTQMRFGPDAEHVTFGQVFFILVMLGVGWLGLRWRDSEAPMPKWLSAPRIAAEPVRPAVLAWAPTIAAVSVLLAAPPYQEAFAAQVRDRSADATKSVRLPVSAGAWRGPLQGEHGWRPLYRNGLVELQGTYRGSASEPVYAFVAVYGLGATAGAEMISYDNVLFEDQHKTVSDETRREVKLAHDRTMTVREVLVPEHAGGYLVWHWYMFGVRPVTNRFIVKALEAMALVTSTAATERSVTLATPLDERARERLQSFVAAHPDCVASGFAAEACGG